MSAEFWLVFLADHREPELTRTSNALCGAQWVLIFWRGVSYLGGNFHVSRIPETSKCQIIQIGWTREPPPPDRAVPMVPIVPPLRSVQNVTAAQGQFNSSNVQLFDALTMSGVFCKPSSRWGNLDVSRTSRSIESTTYAGLSYFGSGIPSWRQILRARRSAISMCRGTVVTRRGSARLTYLLCLDPSSASVHPKRSRCRMSSRRFT